MPPKMDQGVRKILTMPAELVRRIGDFRSMKGIGTEADAIRQLIEQGLISSETPIELSYRVAGLLDEGKSITSVVSDVLAKHPIVVDLTMSRSTLQIDMGEGRRFVCVQDADGSWTYRMVGKRWVYEIAGHVGPLRADIIPVPDDAGIPSTADLRVVRRDGTQFLVELKDDRTNILGKLAVDEPARTAKSSAASALSQSPSPSALGGGRMKRKLAEQDRPGAGPLPLDADDPLGEPAFLRRAATRKR